jgi:hypothetical protein
MKLQPRLVSKEACKDLSTRKGRGMMMTCARTVSERTVACSSIELLGIITKVLATFVMKKQRQKNGRQNRNYRWKTKSEKSRQTPPKSLLKEPSQS